MATKNEIEDFLNGYEVSWLESCLPCPEVLAGYVSLLDCSILHSVWLQIDPEPQHHPVKIQNCDGQTLGNARARNFNAIIQNMKFLYEDELGQTILVLPDSSILGHMPETRQGLEQMKLLITLLLGAAVQCPNKELFIGRIKELDVDLQHGIVELIKQVTDNQTLVLTQESLDHLTPEIMFKHIIRLAKERDQFHTNWMSGLIADSENTTNSGNHKMMTNSATVSSIDTPTSCSSSMSAATTNSTTTSTTENNHLAVELADFKSRLRKLRQELEEKSESYLEVKEELEHKTNQYEKLRLESQEWYTEARRAAAYRDEVDVLRERTERADRLEIEVQRFREKLSDSEFYKTRVEELREDNRMLLETKEMLEEQLQRSRKRSEQVMTLESEIIKYKQKINDMALERDADKTKLQDVLEENTQLQLAAKNLHSVPHDLGQLSQSDGDEDDTISGDNSLSEQLTNSAQTRALKLELENRRLLAALDNLKESSFHENSNKLLELEKDKKKLSIKLDQLQDNCNRLVQQNQELENVFKNALDENKKLQDTVDQKQQLVDKQNHDREMERIKMIDLEKQIETLNKEKQRIQNLTDSIQRRADDLERSMDSKTKDFENLNIKLLEFETIKKDLYDNTGKLSATEKENVNLNKELVKYKENLENKSIQLDEYTIKLEQSAKEIQSLQKEVTTNLKATNRLQELEKQNNDLVSQKKIDTETIQTLQNDLINGTLATKKVKQNLEKLGFNDDNSDDVNVESIVVNLVKNPETFKTVREIMLNHGRDHIQSMDSGEGEGNQMTSTDICVLCHRQEIYTVEKNIEFTNDTIEQEKEKKINSAPVPKQKFVVSVQWKQQYDQLKADNDSLQSQNESLQSENAKQKVNVSTLSSQVTSLNTQHVALQLANSQLAAEKDVLVKQIEMIKQQYESVMHDQRTLQCLHEQLNSEYDSINKEKEFLKINIRDLKIDNRDLKEQIMQLNKIIDEFKLEVESMKKGSISLGNLRAEHSKLKDDFRNLFTTNERYKHEYKSMQEQCRNFRGENSRLQLQNTELTGEFNNRSEQITSLEIELTKVNQRCEMLIQMNANLDTDRRTLMDHVSQLLSQYHELLAHSLEDKQHYHDEEKQFTDKLNNLHRQKEKLEEKIMEHYRKLDSCSPKKKPFAASIMKKVRKAGSDLMNRNRRSWVEDSRLTQSQFTLGSESGGNESDNSLEDHNSIASDSTLIQRNSQLRQSLQRKTSDLLNTSTQTLMRGGVRSSLQASRRDENNQSHRNSFPGFDSGPDLISGNALNLGTAGSRRPVYLVDDNHQKLPETGKSINSKAINNQQNAAAASANVTSTAATGSTPTPTNNSSSDNSPSFLMYNRISNIIGGCGDPALTSLSATTTSAAGNTSNVIDEDDDKNSTGGGSGVGGSGSTKDKKKNDQKNRENAIWYEYGCV